MSWLIFIELYSTIHWHQRGMRDGDVSRSAFIFLVFPQFKEKLDADLVVLVLREVGVLRDHLLG